MAIIALAKQLGFHRAAVVPIEPARRHHVYTSWLAAGMAADMTYLATPEHIEPRADLRRVLPQARSLVVVALAYERVDPVPPAALVRGRIARYARSDDYHMVMRDRLVALADRIAADLGHAVVARPCVDTAPVLEREWAERGGLGFIAKNTMLIAPGLGSYVLLGELLVDADLPPTAPAEPSKPRCGGCRSCLDACPTGAFADAYVLDARRCISYLTIENRGAIPRELRRAVGTWIFGCDICQEVCPFNAGAGEPADPELRPRSDAHALPDLIALAHASSNQLRRFVRRTAMRRAGRTQLLRNVAVALGNSGHPAAIPAAQHLLSHPKPLVRLHAAWALGQLGATDALAHQTDDDPEVNIELAWARQTAGDRGMR